MPRPSAADLIERLRDVYEEREGVRLADEKLAARLPISLSTFNRWKKHDTRSYTDLMEMLELAGWLTLDSRAAPAHPPSPTLPGELEDALVKIVAGQQEGVATLFENQQVIEQRVREVHSAIESLRAHLDDLPSTGRSFPRRRQGNSSA